MPKDTKIPAPVAASPNLKSIQLLSTLWFGLCTSLVLKHHDLLAVFISFCLSFGASIAISWTNGDTLRVQNYFDQSTITTKQRGHNLKTKAQVGILACIAALCLLMKDTSSWIQYFAGNLLNSLLPEFHSLCIMTGYLAFDLWFDQIRCRIFPTRLFSVFEDAITLSLFSVILTKWWDWDMEKSAHVKKSIILWSFYKLNRLVAIVSKRQQSEKLKGPNSKAKENHAGKTCVSSLSPKWTIHGQDYDLSDFVHRHPGGKEAILLGRGRDCTALFESYHPFTEQHRAVLVKYGVKGKSLGTVDKFYDELKERASAVLEQNGIDTKKDRCATISRFCYYFVIATLLVASARYHMQANPLGSFFFALFGWLIGSLGHDAGHFAASRLPLVNDLGVWGMSLLCNPIMWQHQHTFAHHSHTNDAQNDPDLYHFEIMLRVHRSCKHTSIYNNQKHHLYVIAAYALVVFGECIKIPLGMMKTGSLYDMVEYTDRNRPFRALGMYIHYICYLAIIVVSPFFAGKPFAVAAVCPIIHIVVAGWQFGFFSQINHLNELSLESEKGSTNKELLRTSWAAKQVVTSNNFATKSLFWHVLSNGLNMQIEHHLFPGLNHCHLHLIQPVIEETCHEYGVHYKSYETWSDIMNATFQWLDRLSMATE